MARKLIPIPLFALLAVLAAPAPPAHGQQPAQPAAAPKPLKIGVIDPERIVRESVRGKQAIETLNKARDERLAEGNKMKQEIADLQKRVNDGRLSLGQDKLQQMSDEIQAKTVALQRFGEDAQQFMARREQEVMEPIEGQILRVINQVGAEQGFTLIFKKFESGLVFADQSVDLTQTVIQRFDAAPAAAAPAAAARPAATPRP
jgi:Skp family chaperone for outer membrane proteins